MKFLIPSIFILMLVALSIGITVLSAQTATVSATVTAQILSVGVRDGTVAYGTLNVSATQSTIALSDIQVASNDGNVTEKFNIQGATSEAWALVSGTPTGEQYRHRFSTNSGTVWNALTTSYQTLIPSVNQGATKTFDLEILMSDNTTTTAQQNVNVTVQAAAP